MECAGADTLGALVAGALSDGERAAIADHAASCSRCFALLEGLVEGRAASSPAPDDMPASGAVSGLELRSGMRIGRYVIDGRLGAGGMGVVFSAFDTELRRRVAVKRLHADQRGDGADTRRERLMREARALARVFHPHVVSVFDVGTHQDHLFVAMELVDGGSLRTWLQSAPRTSGEIIDRLVEAGRGLAAAHAAGIVHRDVKPDNILIGRDGRARVTDFGLAQVADLDAAPPSAAIAAPLDASRTLTRTGTVIGTPAYMAPEQMARGQSDRRSDQWSFCATLYEALAGVRPFADDVTARAVAIADGRLAAPCAGRRVPGWARRIVARGLLADPAARWPSMEALVQALVRGRRRWRRDAVAGLASVVLSGVAWAVLAGSGPAGDSMPAVLAPIVAAKDPRPGCHCPFSACTDHCVSVCRASDFRPGGLVPGINASGRQEVLLGASADGDAILFLSGEGCKRDRLMLARRRGATFDPIDLTDSVNRSRVSLGEDCCTMLADGETLIMTTADHRGFVRVRVADSELRLGDATEFQDLIPSPRTDVRVEWPVLSLDGLTLYYFIYDPVAVYGDLGPLHGSYVSLRADPKSPFRAGKRLVGHAGRYEHVTGVSSDGLTLFMKYEWETRVLVRSSTSSLFAEVPGATSTRMPGWRTLPLRDCGRLLTTSTPGGCENEDIAYLDAVPAVGPVAGAAAASGASVTRSLAFGKAATQSSTLYGGTASRAVDGVIDGNWATGSVSHTDLNAQAWWQVDLGAMTEIGEIVVYNRTDCCADRLADFSVLVSDDSITWRTVAIASGIAPARTAFSIRAFARHVRIQLRGTGSLSLAEVEVRAPVNLAAGQPATQSSTVSVGEASRAVDGVIEGGWPAGSVTHTGLDTRAWWQVDLSAVKDIGQVVLYNRTDCCAERLADFDIWTSNDGSDWQIAATFAGAAPPRIAMTVGGAARFVRVQLRGKNHLSLAEVQVFPPHNLAAGKTAVQSSTLNGGDASRAVDGNTDGSWWNGSVTHTQLDAQAWWQVDLGAVADLRQIVLYNRTDCCNERLSNFQVLASSDGDAWSMIAAFPRAVGPRTVIPARVPARFVRVQLVDSGHLSLAEVQVLPAQ